MPKYIDLTYKLQAFFKFYQKRFMLFWFSINKKLKNPHNLHEFREYLLKRKQHFFVIKLICEWNTLACKFQTKINRTQTLKMVAQTMHLAIDLGQYILGSIHE